MSKAVFLDRDGVINRKAPEGEYVTCWEEMVFLPGVAGAIASFRQAGFGVIVVSNQRCVAKGLLKTSELEALHRRMREKLAAEGGVIDAVYYCPHDNQPACHCRKPAPGMLLQAAAERRIDLSESWMIGDSCIDVEAGRAAGCRTVRVQDPDEPGDDRADLTARSLADAADQILKIGDLSEASLLSSHKHHVRR